MVAANGKQGYGEYNADAGHRELRELTVPEAPLRIGGMDTRLHPAYVLLEKPPHYERYGNIGIDILNQAQTVTPDFQAMQLTLR